MTVNRYGRDTKQLINIQIMQNYLLFGVDADSSTCKKNANKRYYEDSLQNERG